MCLVIPDSQGGTSSSTFCVWAEIASVKHPGFDGILVKMFWSCMIKLEPRLDFFLPLQCYMQKGQAYFLSWLTKQLVGIILFLSGLAYLTLLAGILISVSWAFIVMGLVLVPDMSENPHGSSLSLLWIMCLTYRQVKCCPGPLCLAHLIWGLLKGR